MTASTSRFKSLYRPADGPAAPDAPASADAPTGLYWPATYPAHGGIRLADAQDWGLHVEGLLETPARFALRNIQAMPQTRQERRWISASGWSIKAPWQGVLLDEIIKRVKPAPEAVWVHQFGLGGQSECMRLDDLLKGKALLCHQANGQALPALYGGPVALMVFDRFSYKGLGQLSRLVFSDAPLPETTARAAGYDPDGTVTPGEYYAFDLKAFRPIREPESY